MPMAIHLRKNLLGKILMQKNGFKKEDSTIYWKNSESYTLRLCERERSPNKLAL